VVLPHPDLQEMPTTELPPGGRGRGLVLHKMIEEVLTGETAEGMPALAVRAAELSATCGFDIDRLDPDELAATVVRTLTLPAITTLRPRLIPEFGVHASFETSGEERVISGIADAIAFAPDGSIGGRAAGRKRRPARLATLAPGLATRRRGRPPTAPAGAAPPWCRYRP
jgi:hypothetical protein